MSTIHHSYRSFHIYHRSDQNAYHVCHDMQPETADELLHHPNLNQAKAYVDVCCDVLYGFIMEPHRSLLFQPFYRAGYRSDGPLPVGLQLVCTDQLPPAHLCQHLYCNVNQRNMAGGSLWQYCGRPVNPRTSRCVAHSRTF